MCKVLIFGVNGQDGSFLAEKELESGTEVVGVGTQAISRWVQNQRRGFKYIQADLTDPLAASRIYRKIQPDIIYYFSAVHGPSGFDYESVLTQMYNVNTVSFVELCNTIVRDRTKDVRVIYASSSKVFSPDIDLISENSPLADNCPYSRSKNIAKAEAEKLRVEHELNVSALYLFNHESERRPSGFFVGKLAKLFLSHSNKEAVCQELGNLDFWCDWGSASEYMDFVLRISHKAACSFEDFVVATGKPILAKRLVDTLSDRFGLVRDSDPSEIHSRNDQYRSGAVADLTKLFDLTGSTPRREAVDVFEDAILKINSLGNNGANHETSSTY